MHRAYRKRGLANDTHWDRKGYHIALKRRMYEVYLMHEMELANIEFDQDHFVPDRLPEETRERLFTLKAVWTDA